MRIVDIILILAFATVVALIIGFNIVSVVDNKISNVSVNVPPIQLPGIVVKIQRESGDYSVYAGTLERDEKPDMNIREGFDNIKNDRISIPESDTVKLTKQTIIETPTFVGDRNNTERSIEYPDHDDIILYNNYICYKKGDEPKNSSNPSNHKSEPKQSVNMDMEIKNNHGEIAGCPYLHNDNTQEPIDPNVFFSSRMKILKTVMDDPRMRGYNNDSFRRYGDILDIGKISLDNDNKYPVGVNYAFDQ